MECIRLVQENVKFLNQTVYLSGQTFLDCTFEHCTLLIREGGTVFSNCKVVGCIFHIDMLVSDHHLWKEFLDGLGRHRYIRVCRGS